jgi:cell division GTPase FtsZ
MRFSINETLYREGEHWDYETSHHIDSQRRQIFEDLISLRNITHVMYEDIENFLATEGIMVSECITRTQSQMPETLDALLASEKFKSIKKIVVCIYSHADMALEDMDKILNGIRASFTPETVMLYGWILDEKMDENSVTVRMIAICSE